MALVHVGYQFESANLPSGWGDWIGEASGSIKNFSDLEVIRDRIKTDLIKRGIIHPSVVIVALTNLTKEFA